LNKIEYYYLNSSQVIATSCTYPDRISTPPLH